MRNIDKAIAIMKRAGWLDMSMWQYGYFSVVVTEEEAHECGTASCVAGWIALSPEFQADGGEVGFGGAPVLGEYGGDEAIAHWLEIGYEDSEALCMVGGHSSYDSEYPTKEDVIKQLEILKHAKHG
jgi:hypothetical protein